MLQGVLIGKRALIDRVRMQPVTANLTSPESLAAALKDMKPTNVLFSS